MVDNLLAHFHLSLLEKLHDGFGRQPRQVRCGYRVGGRSAALNRPCDERLLLLHHLRADGRNLVVNCLHPAADFVLWNLRLWGRLNYKRRTANINQRLTDEAHQNIDLKRHDANRHRRPRRELLTQLRLTAKELVVPRLVALMQQVIESVLADLFASANGAGMAELAHDLKSQFLMRGDGLLNARRLEVLVIVDVLDDCHEWWSLLVREKVEGL